MHPGSHTTVMVPAGHTVQIHAPGGMGGPANGMVPDPAAAGALHAMSQALGPAEGSQAEEAAESPAFERKEQKQGLEAKEPVHKAKKKAKAKGKK